MLNVIHSAKGINKMCTGLIEISWIYFTYYVMSWMDGIVVLHLYRIFVYQ